MKKHLTVLMLLMIAGTVFFFVACDKPDVVPVDNSTPPAPVIPPEPTPGLPEGMQPAPVRTVQDTEVSTRWKSVEITVAEKKDQGQEFKIEIPLGGEMAVEGTPLTIAVLSFVPDFSMGADTIGTKSLDDVNPAVKIKVTEGEDVLFTGWSFRDFPEMHAFEDPRFSVSLTRVIPVE